MKLTDLLLIAALCFAIYGAMRPDNASNLLHNTANSIAQSFR